jgi:diguanylate cyclase (GGDEF)-like protein
VDVGWFAGFLLIAAAAASARPQSADEAGRIDIHESQVKALMPYLPVTLGLAVAVGNQLVGDRDRLAMIGATLVMAVLLVRQLLVVLDNRLLLARLLSTQHELRHQAFHDPLTGLANRSLFADRLRHGLALHQRDLRHVSLLYCDLDAFKAINDTYGHDTGDAVIKAAAERLRAVTRVSDTVARLGGDEFAILLEDGADPQTVALNIVDAFAQPASIAQISIPMAISVGIAELNPSDTPVSPEVLLHRADTAMYYAKRQQKGSAVAWSVRLEANYVS